MNIQSHSLHSLHSIDQTSKSFSSTEKHNNSPYYSQSIHFKNNLTAHATELLILYQKLHKSESTVLLIVAIYHQTQTVHFSTSMQRHCVGAKSGGADSLLRLRLQSLILKN